MCVSMCSSSVVEPSGFRVFGFVGALGVFFQYTKPSLSQTSPPLRLQTSLQTERRSAAEMAAAYTLPGTNAYAYVMLPIRLIVWLAVFALMYPLMLLAR